LSLLCNGLGSNEPFALQIQAASTASLQKVPDCTAAPGHLPFAKTSFSLVPSCFRPIGLGSALSRLQVLKPTLYQNIDGRSACARFRVQVDQDNCILKGIQGMPSGTVKWFNGQKGFGFIQPAAGGPDVFVHISAVERAGMNGLNEGQKVEYEIVQDKRTGKSSAGNLKAE
jgi:cold shock protein